MNATTNNVKDPKEIDFDNIDPGSQLIVMDQDNAYLLDKEDLVKLLTESPEAFDDSTKALMTEALFTEEMDLTDPTKTSMNVICSILSNIGNEGLESVWLEKTSVSGGKLPPALQALARGLDANKAALGGSLSKNVSGQWTVAHKDSKLVDDNGVGNKPDVGADLGVLNQYATAELLENGADPGDVKRANYADNSPLQTAGALGGIAATLDMTELTSLMGTKIDQTMVDQGIIAGADNDATATPAADNPEQVAAIGLDSELLQKPDAPTALSGPG